MIDFSMNNQNYTIFLTGLSGAGKTTISSKIKEIMNDIVVLDGDVLRKGLCEDLGFSDEDRSENMRRLRNVCRLFNDNNKNVITSFISPFEQDRNDAKTFINNCYVVYINSSIETCEKRDVKGLYKKARENKITNFTGIGSNYEIPAKPDLIIDTNKLSIDESVNMLINFIEKYNR